MSLRFDDCYDCKHKPSKGREHSGICIRCKSGELFEDDSIPVRALDPERDMTFRDINTEWFDESE